MSNTQGFSQVQRRLKKIVVLILANLLKDWQTYISSAGCCPLSATAGPESGGARSQQLGPLGCPGVTGTHWLSLNGGGEGVQSCPRHGHGVQFSQWGPQPCHCLVSAPWRVFLQQRVQEPWAPVSTHRAPGWPRAALFCFGTQLLARKPPGLQGGPGSPCPPVDIQVCARGHPGTLTNCAVQR